MSMSSERLGPSPDFAERLAATLFTSAEHYGTLDKPMQFVGTREDGSTGTATYTPRQVADAIVQHTPFGVDQTVFYLEISQNLGDPTGERVIQDLLRLQP